MARGTIALVLGLGVITATMILAIALFITVTGLVNDSSVQPDFAHALWANLLRTLDPGTMGKRGARLPALDAGHHDGRHLRGGNPDRHPDERHRVEAR
jgi:hypothetical protein